MENNDNFLCVGVCLLVWSVDFFFFLFILLAMGRKNVNMLVRASALMKLTANKYPDKSYVRVFVDSM